VDGTQAFVNIQNNNMQKLGLPLQTSVTNTDELNKRT